MDDRSTTQTTGFADGAVDSERSGDHRLAAQIALWASAARARTLPASVAPVLIGVVIAHTDGVRHWPAAAFALLGAVLIQIGANFANDFFDFVNGADTAERKGPRRLVQSGLVRPEVMLRATIIVFGLAVLVGLYLVARGGWPIVIVGVASILCGLLYTGGPFPLGYRGLGDVFVLLFFGPVAVAGTYYVQALGIDWRLIVAGVGPGLISAAILAVNNLRDRETDAKAGKRTLAVLLGVRFTRLEYTICIIAACLTPLVFFATGAAGLFGMLLPLSTLLALPSVNRTVWGDSDGAALNGALAETGKLLMLYAVLFCIGWTISAA
jgi:1,4-dihydroxy-2-naphthoate octaprenyltransferase